MIKKEQKPGDALGTASGSRSHTVAIVTHLLATMNSIFWSLKVTEHASEIYICNPSRLVI